VQTGGEGKRSCTCKPFFKHGLAKENRDKKEGGGRDRNDSGIFLG
jgi:hypothetical protein